MGFPPNFPCGIYFFWVILILVQLFSSRVSGSRGLYSKIGTLEKVFQQYAFIIHPDHRLDSFELKRFLQDVRRFAIPPKRKSVYEVKSEQLGTWIVVVDTVSRLHVIERAHLGKGAGVILSHTLLEIQFDAAEVTSYSIPEWLSPLKATSKRSPGKTPRSARLGNHTLRSSSPNKYIPRSANMERIPERSRNGPGDSMAGLDIIVKEAEGDHLEFLSLSQPPDVESIADMKWQAYIDGEAGKGVLAYVIGSGFDLSHSEFQHLAENRAFIGKSSRNWIYTGPMPDDAKSDLNKPFGNDLVVEDPIDLYGTNAASKIVGIDTGIAPSTELVVVKGITGRNTFTEISQIDSLLKIFDHWWETQATDTSGANGIKGAVILQTFSWEFASTSHPWKKSLLSLIDDGLKNLELLNAHFFVEDNVKSNSQPAAHILSNPQKYKKSAVVGAVNPETGGHLYRKSPNHGIKIYAPGSHSKVPSSIDNFDYLIGRIHGLAASLAAGLCATLITRGWSQPLDRMRELAWKRAEKGPKVIWNGIQKSDWSRARTAAPDESEDIEMTM